MSTGIPFTADSNGHAAADVSDLRVRVQYGLFLVVGFVLGLLLKNDVVDWVVKWSINKNGDCDASECVSVQGAYRVSFALFVFFLGHYLVTHNCNCCLNADQRVSFNRPKMFFLRAIAFFALLVIAFVIPNPFFTYYAWFALVVSCFYLIGQLVLLMHFAYEWNDDWRKRDEDKYTYGLLFCTAVMYAGGITLTVFLFKWFGSSAACSTGQGIVISTLIAAVLYSALCLWVPHGSLLPSSLVFLYCTWLCYSGLSSGTTGECNTIQSTSTTQMVVGAVVSAVSLAIAATNAGQSKDAFELDRQDPAVNEVDGAASAFQFFHFMMMMGSCYLAMLLSSWAITGSEGVTTNPDTGATSMWVKLGSEILCMVFYFWTLLAPKLFPDREFG